MVSRYLNGKKGFILVSHDRAFLDGCVDHILSINRATIEVQKGGFSSWEENRKAAGHVSSRRKTSDSRARANS